MSELDDKIVDEFLVDSYEGLDRLDHDVVELERDPASSRALGSAFRSLHTIKGTCAFLGYQRLERVAHAGESLLARLRAGEMTWTPEITGTLLAVVDVVRRILASIESTRREEGGDDSALIARIERHLGGGPATVGARAAAAPAAAPDADLQRQHVRVDVLVLDRLVNLVGELVLARNQLQQFVAQQDWLSLPASAQRIDGITTRLQEETMRTRMQPVSTLWTRLPRLVRDVAAACGKQVRLEMEGTNTELDKTLVEALKDPLTHLVRNAVDHGIEAPARRIELGKPAEGRLLLRAWHEGGQVHLEIADDGAGLSIERIRGKALENGLVTPEQAAGMSERAWMDLVFVPGFSTASRVTSVSGRGVGMDVVKSSVERVGGSIELVSSPGSGTRVHVRIPLTLAIIPALIVEDGGDRFAVPQAHLVELVRASASELPSRIEWVQGAPVYRLRGRLLPLVFLGQHLRGAEPRALARAHVVVLRAEGRLFGLVVPAVHDTEEIVVKPLSERLRGTACFAGATIRGDGRVALILDVPALARMAGLNAPLLAAIVPPPPQSVAPNALLLVNPAPGTRAAVALRQVVRIEELAPRDIERCGARLAARWRGEVLPLAALAAVIDPGAHAVPAEGRAVSVLVHRHGTQLVGFFVDGIVDVLESGASPDPDGRIVVDERITHLVDLDEAARTLFGAVALEAA